MHGSYEEFIEMLEREDKRGCVDFALERLCSGELDIMTLYTEILTPAQNQLVCWQDEFLCIWKEHVRTAIVRTILECCYPYVVKESEKHKLANGEKVILVCPSEEYHEIGPRMAADFFTLLGYDVTFVGANTPQNEILKALEHIKPHIIGISVTNVYNLVAAGNIVGLFRKERGEKNLDFNIIVGGNAFRMNPDAHKDMGVDAVLQTFGDLKRYTKEAMGR